MKLQVVMTIDGFIAGTISEMDWMEANWDDKLKDYIKEITEPVDCIVLGRKRAQSFIVNKCNPLSLRHSCSLLGQKLN